MRKEEEEKRKSSRRRSPVAGARPHSNADHPAPRGGDTGTGTDTDTDTDAAAEQSSACRDSFFFPGKQGKCHYCLRCCYRQRDLPAPGGEPAAPGIVLPHPLLLAFSRPGLRLTHPDTCDVHLVLFLSQHEIERGTVTHVVRSIYKYINTHAFPSSFSVRVCS